MHLVASPSGTGARQPRPGRRAVHRHRHVSVGVPAVLRKLAVVVPLRIRLARVLSSTCRTTSVSHVGAGLAGGVAPGWSQVHRGIVWVPVENARGMVGGGVLVRIGAGPVVVAGWSGGSDTTHTMRLGGIDEAGRGGALGPHNRRRGGGIIVAGVSVGLAWGEVRLRRRMRRFERRRRNVGSGALAGEVLEEVVGEVEVPEAVVVPAHAL